MADGTSSSERYVTPTREVVEAAQRRARSQCSRLGVSHLADDVAQQAILRWAVTFKPSLGKPESWVKYLVRTYAIEAWRCEARHWRDAESADLAEREELRRSSHVTTPLDEAVDRQHARDLREELSTTDLRILDAAVGEANEIALELGTTASVVSRRRAALTVRAAEICQTAKGTKIRRIPIELALWGDG